MVDLRGYSGPLKIRLRAVAAGGPRGDMAIDSIEVTGWDLYGDMNGDYQVDIGDLAGLADNWLQVTSDLDLDGDTVITLHEFAEFTKNWLKE